MVGYLGKIQTLSYWNYLHSLYLVEKRSLHQILGIWQVDMKLLQEQLQHLHLILIDPHLACPLGYLEFLDHQNELLESIQVEAEL
ncbi:hypothetical protein [Bartonella sp. AC134YNZD]|uniref:hypothetical protein n=1 Tax=Bartonella sp. AC134YNZD TaxID=3243446 RepID=UPI0035D048BE